MLISCHYNNIITFGSLVGISNILELPRRSIGRAKTQVLKRKRGKKSKSRSWLFCLCSNSNSGSNPDAENNPPSLGQFLALERRASNENRKNQIISLLIMCPDNELALTQTIEEARSYILFVNGTIDPSQSISSRQNPQREHMQGIRVRQYIVWLTCWYMSLIVCTSFSWLTKDLHIYLICLCGQACKGMFGFELGDLSF